MELKNKKWTEAEFLKEREEVLKTWHTGSSPLLNLDVAIENLKRVPEEKNFAIALNKAK